jgi:hypothetical protein
MFDGAAGLATLSASCAVSEAAISSSERRSGSHELAGGSVRRRRGGGSGTLRFGHEIVFILPSPVS